MSERDAGALQTRLNELVRKFVGRTALDLAQMREGLARVEAGDRSGLAQIYHLAHRTCGTSGTLGLLGLSDAAADLERRIAAFAQDAIPDTAERAQIAAGIDKIAAQVKLL